VFPHVGERNAILMVLIFFFSAKEVFALVATCLFVVILK
jgi:hypothetical protein